MRNSTGILAVFYVKTVFDDKSWRRNYDNKQGGPHPFMIHWKEEENDLQPVEIPMPGVPKDLPIDIPATWRDGSAGDAVTDKQVGKPLQESDFWEPENGGNFTTEFDSFDTQDKDEKRRKRP